MSDATVIATRAPSLSAAWATLALRLLGSETYDPSGRRSVTPNRAGRGEEMATASGSGASNHLARRHFRYRNFAV
jgi:hypothetical protein